MSQEYPRYPAYKDSGVEWLGEVPEGWKISRVGDIAKIINGYPFNADLFAAEGKFPLLRIRDLNQSSTETRYNGEFVPEAAVDSSDVLVGMDGDFNVGRWFGQEVALLNQRVSCIRAESKVVSKLLGYALPYPLKLINDITYSTTVKHLSSYQIAKIRVSLPIKAAELDCITTFLDRETSRLDALITEQRRLIDLLREKRSALISHAVTKGLDPNVPMKDSGVEWLGMVPEHWDVARVKHLTRLESGHTPDKKNPEFWENCQIPWVSLKDSETLRNVDYIHDTNTYINEHGLAGSSARMLPTGTVVFTRDATIGLCAITARPMAVSQHLIGWVSTGKLDPEFLLLVFEAMAPWLESLTEGATIKTIGIDDVGILTTPYPPMDEQIQIAAYIHSVKETMARLISQTERSLDLLLERRSALITAAVTGKIDVRGLVEA